MADFTDLQKEIILIVARHSGATYKEIRNGVGEETKARDLLSALRILRTAAVIYRTAGDAVNDPVYKLRKEKLKFYFNIKYEIHARNS